MGKKNIYKSVYVCVSAVMKPLKLLSTIPELWRVFHYIFFLFLYCETFSRFFKRLFLFLFISMFNRRL